MGWSTELFCNISFNRKSYNFLYEVQEDLAEVDKMIKFNENKIRALAVMTEPSKMITLEDEYSSYLDEALRQADQALEDLRGYYMDHDNLTLLIENWDNCHDDKGLAIEPPEGVSWDKAYLYGDFVKSANNEVDSE